MITNEVPVMILQACFSLPRHIRNGMFIRMIITSDLCTAVGCQQFRKESRKLQRRITFERNLNFKGELRLNELGAEPSDAGGYGGLGAKPPATRQFFMIVWKKAVLMPFDHISHEFRAI